MIQTLQLLSVILTFDPRESKSLSVLLWAYRTSTMKALLAMKLYDDIDVLQLLSFSVPTHSDIYLNHCSEGAYDILVS